MSLVVSDGVIRDQNVSKVITEGASFSRAKQILREVAEELKQKYRFRRKPLRVEFSGVAQFNTYTVYTKPKEGPAKDTLKEIAGT